MNISNFDSRVRGVFLLRQVWVLVFVCACAISMSSQSALGSERALVVTRAADVVRQWQPEQRVYVKGNLGVSAERLDGLEQWLDTNAPNWVVVLAEDAQGETYTDASGDSFQGVEAVNQALGKGLMNQTAFGQQVDPRTRERNAAFFLLFLKERKLSYYGSDAQDRRGLGEEDWIGNLDRAAIAAMRDGGRVIDAAKDTITSINTKLDQRIASEAAARAKQAADQLAARQRAQGQAKAALANAQSEYALLESKARELSRRLKGVEGDLARPDLAGMAAELKLAQGAMDRGDTAAASRGAETVRTRAQQLIRGIDQYPAGEEKLKTLEEQLAGYEKRVNGGKGTAKSALGQSALPAAREAVVAARQEYARGNSAYVALLDQAGRAVAAAGSAVAMTERVAAQQRVLMAMSAVALTLMVGVVALLLNRRRLPAKTEARQLHDLWEKALGEKDSALFTLMGRRSTLIGGSAKDTAARFSGETLRLCEQIIRDVDLLFIMSVCAGRVLKEAGGQVNPGNATGRFLNLFRKRPYQRAIALLKDQPIAFRPEEGLEVLVRGIRTERERLVGSLESYQPFTMTFNELVEKFNKTAESALNALERVETSLLKGPEELQAIQTRIDGARSSEAGLRQASTDGLFLLTPVFGDLLPAAQQALSDAMTTAIHDPVGALQGAGARARRQNEDAAALVAAATRALQQTSPAARECAAALEQSGLKPAWLETRLAALSEAADEAGSSAVREGAVELIESLNARLVALEESSRRALLIDEARREPARKAIAESTALIDQARHEIGAGLRLPAGEILREPGKDPTDYVAQATEQWNAAFASLERGDLEAAQSALDSAHAQTAEADAIVAASRAAFTEHEGLLQSLRKEVQEVTAEVPQRAQVLAEIQAGYAPSVLALGAGDIEHPNANGTLGDNIQEAETLLTAIRESLDRSVTSFNGASLLQAVDLLAHGRGQLEVARHRLAEITDKKNRLEAAVASNRQRLAAVDERSRECAALAVDPSTMAPTLRVFEEATRALAQAREAVQVVPRDPFFAANALSDAEKRHASMADMARCDRDLFEQVGRSLAAAANQASEARRLAERTGIDNIPDSGAIRQACAEVDSLQDALQRLQSQHRTPHEDWGALDRAAIELTNRGAAAAATLRGELERAQAALAILSTAASSVRNAGAWTGGFGVLIMGTPGSDSLSQAQAHLARGEYDMALRLAENARATADRAVAQAQAEVMRRRREEEERRERERRQRQAEEAARQRRSTSFGSGSMGSSRSSSWGSSGSGTRSSSFRSGSGVRTSSW